MQGGANAGHTIYDSSGKKYALHLVPSGILNEAAQCVVGNGVVVHLPTLFEEIATLEGQGVSTQRLIISERAHLLFDLHKACCPSASVAADANMMKAGWRVPGNAKNTAATLLAT